MVTHTNQVGGYWSFRSYRSRMIIYSPLPDVFIYAVRLPSSLNDRLFTRVDADRDEWTENQSRYSGGGDCREHQEPCQIRSIWECGNQRQAGLPAVFNVARSFGWNVGEGIRERIGGFPSELQKSSLSSWFSGTELRGTILLSTGDAVTGADTL